MTDKLIETIDPSDSPLDANGFIGVSPEYQNFANATDRPLNEGDEVEDDAKVDEKIDDEKKADDKKVEGKAPVITPAAVPAAPAK